MELIWLGYGWGLSYYPMGKSLRIEDLNDGVASRIFEPLDEYALISVDILAAWSMIVY